MKQFRLIAAAEAEAGPALTADLWFNADGAPETEGRVVILHAFQMLCPGCVAHGIPQAQRIQQTFDPADVCVIGLHTVFEHHEAMQPVSLRAFLHEYRVEFPVGVDTPRLDSRIPTTMAAFEMHGTPTLILLDRRGRVRLHAFGRPDDMAVGAAVAALVAEPADEACDADGCRI